MKNNLLKLYSIIKVLNKLIPIIIEVLQDLSDDGKVNNSTPKPKTNKFFNKKTK